ncbi:hypothetical protein CEXT_14031 [Caerostris extrusa]|uniref:Uncharacterized protein n=1 Tax=Caerostris extrusa TaxID=172846 RepID=A0AAV4MCT3_CAEEX|nr:hypothetical protein CEXT_14031 [Caerostris extrusa]
MFEIKNMDKSLIYSMEEFKSSSFSSIPSMLRRVIGDSERRYGDVFGGSLEHFAAPAGVGNFFQGLLASTPQTSKCGGGDKEV